MGRRASFRAVTLLLFVGIFLFGMLLAPAGCKKKKAEIPYPDYSSPKNTAVTFARAMERDDAKVAVDSSLAGGMEVDLVENMCHATHALKELAKVARAKFGDEGDQALRGAATVDASASLANGEVTFDGEDRASVMPQAGNTAVPVTHNADDDTWKVDIGALIKGDDVTHSIPLLKVLTTVANDVRADLEAGKLKSADEVKKALAARIVQLAAQSGAPTTLPTSLPVGGV
jgi:hypothetical protein